MNSIFLVQTVILLILKNERVSALGVEKKFTTSASIESYLRNQWNMAQANFSAFPTDQIQVGNRTFTIMKKNDSSPRISSDDIALIFHENGTITYNMDGVSKPLITVRAGDFQIDAEIFGLVFPGFSMDTKGNNTSTTTKEKEELTQTTPNTLATTRPTMTSKTTKKNPLPHKNPKSSAGLGRISVLTILFLSSLGMGLL